MQESTLIKEQPKLKTPQEEQFETYVRTNYHKSWMQKIRKQTGAKHATHVRANGEYFIHTHFTNETGGTDVIKYQLQVEHPNEMRDYDYKALIDALNENKD